MRRGTAAVIGACCGVLLVLVAVGVVLACRRRLLRKLLDVPCGEVLVVIVPHRDREPFVEYLVPQLCTYLSERHRCAVVRVLCVEQSDPGPYAKGLSWNVGLRYLDREGYGPETSLVLNDADILPRWNVSYACPEGRGGVLWFQNTGGLKVRLGQMLRAHGFPMAVTGWGYEDVAMWRRLEQLADANLTHWVEELRAAGAGPAVVMNLEWGTMDEEEAEGSREWYWGDDRKWVRMVQQSDEDWGVARDGRRAVLEPPSKDGWYQEAKRRRNEVLDQRLEALSPEDFRRLADVDGAASLRVGSLRAVPFGTRFPNAAKISSGCEAWNLRFDSAEVLGTTPRLFLEKPELGWYFDGPTECEEGGDDTCGSGQKCETGACMPTPG